MKLKVLMCVTAITILAVLALPTQCFAQNPKTELPHYTVIDLGTLGGTYSLAGGLSFNGGWIDGYSSLPDGDYHAVLWRNGAITDLGTLGGPNSWAGYRPSDYGEVGGGSENVTPDPNHEDYCGFGTYLECHPFFWRDGVMTPLPLLGGNNGVAAGFNNRGQVAGQAEYNTPDPTCILPGDYLRVGAVVWENGRIIENLHPLPGDPDAVAWAINDWGQATGSSGGCSIPPYHAVLWQNGSAINLGNLGGTMAVGADINNLGQVAGYSYLQGNTYYHAFLWAWGVMNDLGTLPGDVSSSGDGINDRGQVVGGSYSASGGYRAYIWQNGMMTDLNTLIPPNSPLYLLEATGTINDFGQIAGIALQISTDQVHAFLATPSMDTAETTAPAAQSQSVPRPNITLPENVRKLLQRRVRFGGLKGGLVTPP